MALTPKQIEDLFAERNDGHKAIIMCEDHFYAGPIPGRPETKPVKGCRKCWFIFYLKQLLDTPPDRRGQFLAELTETMHEVDALVRQGKFDLKLHRPEITIEPDGPQD